eukprot:5126160-Karenia_brevis.AAC.1
MEAKHIKQQATRPTSDDRHCVSPASSLLEMDVQKQIPSYIKPFQAPLCRCSLALDINFAHTDMAA